VPVASTVRLLASCANSRLRLMCNNPVVITLIYPVMITKEILA
jgi:hypothetical protein